MASSAIGAVASSQDYYSTDDASNFTLKFTHAVYDSGDYGVPTMRDVYQESEYIQSVLDIYNENKVILNIEPYIDTTNYRRYLKAKIPLMQANWRTVEINNIADITELDGSQKLYLTVDGLKDVNSEYKDAVLKETVRVFVLPSGYSNWTTESIEFTNIMDQPLSANLNQFKLNYDQTYGLYVKFNISNFSKELQTGDKLRAIFATTKGDDINDVEGTNEFNPTAGNMADIGYLQINETNGSTLYETELGVVAVGSNTYSEGGSNYDAITLRMVDENDNLDTFDDGQAKQDLDSIKEIAPLYYNAQGRAIIADDLYPIVKSKFTEFRDIAVWGGHTEFLDLNQVLNDAFDDNDITAPSSLTLSEFKLAFRQANYQVSKYGLLAVESIIDSSINSGDYKPDLGHFYYSLIGQNFDFETQASTYSMIEDFIDGKKIETIFMKHMYPTYLCMNINLVLKVNKAYTNNISASDLKQRIRDYVNTKTYYAKKTFNIEDLKSVIQDYDEISLVTSLNITYNAKIKPTAVSVPLTPTISEYTYLRVFNQLTGDIGSPSVINAVDNNGKQYRFYSDSSSTPVIKIQDVASGVIYTQTSWLFNENLGMLRFQYDFNDADYVYINNIPIRNLNNQILSNKECILGVEFVDDINIILT
jgi:hypothetical protein